MYQFCSSGLSSKRTPIKSVRKWLIMVTINCRFNRNWQVCQSFAASGVCPVLYFVLRAALSLQHWPKDGLLSTQYVNGLLSSSFSQWIASKVWRVSVLCQDSSPTQPANKAFWSYVGWLYTVGWQAGGEWVGTGIGRGSAVWVELRAVGFMMATRGRQCGTCSNSASYLCCCVYPLLPLCDFCADKHPTQFPGQHLLAEMTVVPPQLNSSQWGELHEHLKSCKTAESCVDLSIEEIRDCMSAIQHQFLPSSPLVAIPVLDELSRLIDDLNSDLVQGWSQVCELLFSQDWTGCSEYPRWMLNCTHEPKSLFTWRLGQGNSNAVGLAYQISIPETQVESGKRENCQGKHPIRSFSERSQSSLALMSANSLHFFDCTCETWSQTPIEPHISELEGCLLLINTDFDVYLSVEGDSYNTAISHVCIYTPNGYTQRYIPLLAARAFPGVYINRSSLYLFGGVRVEGDITASNERLDIHFPRFEPMPSMLTARRSFTPCEKGENVYICGGFNTTLCEKYNFPTQQFSQIPLILPEISDILAYWRGDELLIVSSHFTVQWTLCGQLSVNTHAEWSGLAGCSELFWEGETLYNAALGHVNAFCNATSRCKRFSPSSFDR